MDHLGRPPGYSTVMLALFTMRGDVVLSRPRVVGARLR